MNYLILTALALMVVTPVAAWEPDTSKFPEDKAALPAHLENMRPGQIRDAVAQGAVCLLPVGTLEAVADDVPLGADAAATEDALLALAKKRNAVIAPPIWYTPTGYVLGAPADGTFDTPTEAFAGYLREVLTTLTALGFKRIEIVLVNNPQGKDGALYTTCRFVLGDLFNDFWKDPQVGENWWIRPDFEKLNWARYDIVELQVKRPEKRAPAAAPVVQLEHMTPAELRDALRRGLPCFVPCGVLENHGNQNPVACDAFEAREPVLLAAAKAPAVVAPTIWYGPTGYAVTGPKLGTTNIDSRPYQPYVRGIVEGLAAMGFRNILLVQVHQGGEGAQGSSAGLAAAQYRSRLHEQYGPGWGKRLKAEEQKHARVEVIAVPHGQYDHAGKNETSWMLHLKPEFTDLKLLREGDYPYCWEKNGPAKDATAEWGRQMTEKAVEALVKLMRERTQVKQP